MPDKGTIRVLHVDDHELTRAGCKLLLSGHDRFEIVNSLDRGSTVIASMHEDPADIVLLDIQLPDILGTSLVAELSGIFEVPVVLLTGMEDAATFANALRLGVNGIVRKSDPSQEIIAALDSAMRGETYLSTTVAEQMASYRKPPVSLSRRQASILHFMATGESNKEISYRLGIAMPTVSFHLAEMRRKLGVTSNRKIVREAMQQGMI